MLTVLTIAGFDPSGGAGVLADCKTFAAFGCFGTAAITSLTAQNTVAVYGAYHQSAEVLRAQLTPLVEDFSLAAVKTGMLPTRETIEETAATIERHALPHVVVDPVIRSTSGYDLIDSVALAALRERLLPLADVITPNMAEAERLTGLPVKTLDEMKRAARLIREQALAGRRSDAEVARRCAVLVKGGHLDGDAADVLDDGETVQVFRAPRRCRSADALPARQRAATASTKCFACRAGDAAAVTFRQAQTRRPRGSSSARRRLARR